MIEVATQGLHQRVEDWLTKLKKARKIVYAIKKGMENCNQQNVLNWGIRKKEDFTIAERDPSWNLFKK